METGFKYVRCNKNNMSLKCVSGSVTLINKDSEQSSKIPPYERVELWDAWLSGNIPDWVRLAQKYISESTDIWKSILLELINFGSP